ncbi:pyroglutamyl-peptidase I [Comamonas sp.]|uniref:pyroglutamyl-peptidase I n=1 Tax=Comamonas sp. TaxID=34028 RepID=UPI0028A0ED19|nr:pyroglutamyl-peptidase I [Comamonas sp.]
MTDTTVLVLGFEPFDKAPLNPAWEVARRLDGMTIDGARVAGVQLPCVFGKALEALDAALQQHQPSLVIALGLAGGRTALSIERVAINVDDARIADNAGQQPIDVAVATDGPAAYFARLPIKQAVAAMRAAGVPAEVSNTAGTFVCNHVFYGLMHRLNTVPAWAQTRGGFVHVPYLPEMAAALPGAPSMAVETQCKGIEALIAAVLRHDPEQQDLQLSAGQLH